MSLGFLLLLVSGLFLAGCSRRETRKELDFRFALPESWDVDEVMRLDTDGDNENEWVILYAFDNPGDKEFAPIRGAVYDIARREPKLPIVYPYHLQAPGWTFLGEGMGNLSVRIEDVVSVAPVGTAGDAAEIIVESLGRDDFAKRVSIYRWQDNIPPEIRKRTDPHEILLVPGQPLASGEWYECIGMFVGTIKVDLGIDQVTVFDHLNDRSQLAMVSEYRAKAALGGYLNASYELDEPQSVCIDFAHGMPANLAESPYAEKIVLGYQKTFNQDPGYGRDYLTTNAQNNRASGEPWEYFVPGTQDVCVKQISYGPGDETESEVKSFGVADDQTKTEIEVREHPSDTPSPPADASPILARVQTTGTYHLPGRDGLQTITIEWTLVRDPKPAGEPEMWKIDSIREIK